MDALIAIVAILGAFMAVDLADIPWSGDGRRPLAGHD